MEPGQSIGIEAHLSPAKPPQPQSEAIKNEVKFRELQGLRDSIIQTLVNDMKDPLTVVQGGLAYILEELHENGGFVTDKIEKALHNSLLNCKRQMNLINDLYDVNQFDLGKLYVRKTKSSFVSLLESTLMELEPLIEKYGINIRKIIAKNIPLLFLDEMMIKRVLVNLISNSLKFTKPGGKILITVGINGSGSLECVIEDTGLLIPEEHITRIFDKFFKGDYLGRFRKGQGFGLAFCRLAVEAHGGDIWAERVIPKGNRFAMVLPAA